MRYVNLCRNTSETTDITDIPAHSYQLSFEPNPRWPEFYAAGRDIHQYWKGVATKYGVQKYVRLGHEVVECRWDESLSVWHVKIRKTSTGEIIQDSAHILYNCIGALNDWKWPDIDGLHSFNGDLLHSANWDDNWDPVVSALMSSGFFAKRSRIGQICSRYRFRI